MNINDGLFKKEVSDESIQWVRYNKSKPWSNRWGLSLFSLDGGTTGEIDLNSILEWNRHHQTSYRELSFSTPTPCWQHFKSVSVQFKEIVDCFGRSHILRLNAGGIFPPHRDNFSYSEPTFRLLAFVNCIPENFHFMLDGNLKAFLPNHFYFLNTRKVHSVVSFEDNAYLVVFNLKMCAKTYDFIMGKLLQY